MEWSGCDLKAEAYEHHGCPGVEHLIRPNVTFRNALLEKWLPNAPNLCSAHRPSPTTSTNQVGVFLLITLIFCVKHLFFVVLKLNDAAFDAQWDEKFNALVLKYAEAKERYEEKYRFVHSIKKNLKSRLSI